MQFSLWKSDSIVNAKADTAQVAGQIEDEEDRQHLPLIADALQYQISTDEHGACIAGEGEQILPLLSGNLSLEKKVSGQLGTHGIAAQSSKEENISAVRRESEEGGPDFSEGIQYFSDTVEADQKIGEDHKGEQRRKQCAKPQKQAFPRRFQGYLWEGKHEEK